MLGLLHCFIVRYFTSMSNDNLQRICNFSRSAYIIMLSKKGTELWYMIITVYNMFLEKD
jgi:hypothetical protein